MAVAFLDLKAQHAAIASEIGDAMQRVLDSQQFILGPEVERFENALRERVGTRHGIGVASGTDALLLGVRALQLPKDAEVIVPAFTFFATAGAVANAGAKPVFVDVDADTFNLTAETIEAGLTPRTAAIIAVHLYGQMASMQPVLELAASRGIPVIEDVAQAQGARQSGFAGEAGSAADVGTFSFFPTKILGAFGDAGAVTTNDDTIADRVRKLRVHGGRQMYHHEMVGTNSRLDALQAAVLSAKLPSVESWVSARRRIAGMYDERLREVAGVRIPVVQPGNHHVYAVYTLRAERRDALREHLTERGIGSSVYYPLALHRQECFESMLGGSVELPVSEALTGEVISLPIYPGMQEAQVDEVVDAIRTFYGR